MGRSAEGISAISTGRDISASQIWRRVFGDALAILLPRLSAGSRCIGTLVEKPDESDAQLTTSISLQAPSNRLGTRVESMRARNASASLPCHASSGSKPGSSALPAPAVLEGMVSPQPGGQPSGNGLLGDAGG